MKIKESDSDQYGTYITGLTYTGVLAIILLLFCFLINDSWFDYSLTFILIAVIGIAFFISGLKKVKENKVGFLRKLGKRDFEEYYSEGWWWIFPLLSFIQKPHFDILNEGIPVRLNFVTIDKMRLDIQVKYYWQLKNIEINVKRDNLSYIHDVLEFELGLLVKNGYAMELLCDVEVSNKVMVNYLKNAGEKIGVIISDVFPNINWENGYNDVIRKNQEDYEKLRFELDKRLKYQSIKASDMQIYQNQVRNCIKDLGFSNVEALNFIKVYKNQVNMNESTYNIGDLNKVIDSVMSFFKK